VRAGLGADEDGTGGGCEGGREMARFEMAGELRLERPFAHIEPSRPEGLLVMIEWKRLYRELEMEEGNQDAGEWIPLRRGQWPYRCEK